MKVCMEANQMPRPWDFPVKIRRSQMGFFGVISALAVPAFHVAAVSGRGSRSRARISRRAVMGEG